MSYLKIIRPANFIFVGLCVALGATYPGYQISIEFWRLLAAILSAMFIAAAGYTVNDYYDIEIDKVNKPERVLPSGGMSTGNALLYSIALFVTGIIFSYFTGSVICLLIAFINSMFLFLYALFFKREFITGNLLVAYASASCFIFGGIAGGNFSNSLIIAFFAFFYTFLREIVKDLEDVKGDSLAGASTLAIRWEKGKVLRLCLIPVLAITGFTAYLFITEGISDALFILLLFFVVMPMLVFYRIVVSRNEEKIYHNVSKLMKLDMFVLLIIFSLGKFL
ncbi:MAG: geranylgeranylglycerol-phosphate geranylgeranyltransferase [Candidatus Cloacimonetes bacterium]|nr:geranylgeranylglycerol-phosphate geranylgeranyltransferase [Candidatus Cloacimonadota bacterium]